MDLSKVMAISGKTGLFKIVSQSRGSIIVESLVDGKKVPVFATHRSSILEDISMFTYSEDVPLKKVLWAIYQKEEGKNVSLDLNNNNQLKEYFESVLPDYDKERVYASDIKKVFVWYNQLLEHNLISEPKEEETTETTDESKEEPTAAASTEVKKKAKKASKKDQKDSEK